MEVPEQPHEGLILEMLRHDRARLCPQVARAARLRLRDDAVKRSVREEEIVAALSAASGCETSWLCCGLGASARGLLAGDHETVPVAMARGDL